MGIVVSTDSAKNLLEFLHKHYWASPLDWLLM